MAGLYTKYFGDSRHSGYISGSTAAAGELAWIRPIDEVGGQAEARLVLSSGEIVIIDGMNEIFAFSPDGRRLWRRRKYYGTQVALQDGMLYYTTAGKKDRMEAVDLNNSLRLENFLIPDVGSRSYIVLFEPTEKGLIAQVQYASQPDMGTASFVVFHSPIRGFDYDWCRGFQRSQSPLVPLVSFEHRRLVTTIPWEAIVLDIDAAVPMPEPAARFPLPFKKGTAWVSCGADGSLYWVGHNDQGLHLMVTDFGGNQIWSWSSADSSAVPPLWPIAPPILSTERAHILTREYLLALSKGTILWRFASAQSALRACTALADGTLLLTSGGTLYHLNEAGEILFDIKLDEPPVSAPVIDKNGRIYLAGPETLYAID